MSELALHDVPLAPVPTAKPDLDQKPHFSAVLVFILLLVTGVGYAAYGILTDTSSVGEPLALTALVLLGIALMIALVFEFVNGFPPCAYVKCCLPMRSPTVTTMRFQPIIVPSPRAMATETLTQVGIKRVPASKLRRYSLRTAISCGSNLASASGSKRIASEARYISLRRFCVAAAGTRRIDP